MEEFNVSRTWKIILGILAAILVIGCCVCALVGFGAAYFLVRPAAHSIVAIAPEPIEVATVQPEETSTPTETTPITPPTWTPQPTSTTLPTPVATAVLTATAEAAVGFTDTLQTLENTNIPLNDMADLARRLKGIEDIPATVPPPSEPPKLGDRQLFWALNTDENQNFQVKASLRYITDHAYFWIQDGINYSPRELKALADTFENKIYPTDREFFGSEWTPGIDDDIHLYILYARGVGQHIAGYFSSIDEYPPQVFDYSNAHEMFVFNADSTKLGQSYTYSTLAHEFQHMIHWNIDRNEDVWMNEGFSELAALLNGYGVGGADFAYAAQPDIQLNNWPMDNPERPGHYGASFLFLTYFLDRFGAEITRAVVANPANGLNAIDDVLRQFNVTDPQTNKPLTADDVFADWVLTSFLQDGSVGDGRYTYHNYSDAPQPAVVDKIRSCPSENNSRDVSQYGVDYISITCPGDYKLHFEGFQQVPIVPAGPHSGLYSFWSNQGDESDMTLTRTFDFTNVSGPLTLDYWTWFDLEKGYDYVYLEASVDGKNWEILNTPSGTGDNPVGNSYGWGYTGLSGSEADSAQWIQESVDLSKYAGKQVQLRFEYVTDTGVTGSGFLLDDVTIPEVNYFTDFEQDNGGWEGDGFVRIQNFLPQTFRVALIKLGATATVEPLNLSTANKVDVPIQTGGDVDRIILVVSGTTRFTREKAIYNYSIQP
jgi:immune inhibitor A